MRKVFSFMLIAAGLMVSAQGKAANVASVTIGDQVTEYATLADAVVYAQTKGEGLIKLLPAYSSTAYPQAWVDTCKIDWPTGYDENDKCFFTFHAFNPANGDETIGEAKAAGTLSAQADIARFTQILQEVDPTFDPTGVDIPNFSMKKLNGYADWHSDFEVYFDADIAAADYTIGGNYADYGWIYEDQDHNPISKDMKAGERIRLLQAFDNNLKYWELLSKVRQFHCGVISLNPDANAGKTIYVDLYMYAEGNENIKILMGTTPYTFPIKDQPIITHNQVEETTANKEVLGQLKAGNAGVEAMTLDETNIVSATIGFESDKDKCILVILTEISIEETGGTYVERLNSTTFNVTPKYQDANGVLQTIPNSEIDEPITFRLPVIKEYAGKMVDVYHKANAQAVEDLVGQFPVQKMDTSYYVELSAKEFSLYKIKDAGAQYNRATTDGMIGTICLPYDVDVATGATGATFYELDYRNNADVTKVTEVSGPEVTTTLLGGKAYLFIADNSGNLHCEWAPGAESHAAADTCAMVGNLSNIPVYPALLASAIVAPYVVSNTGIIRPCGDGAYVPMNRAYLNMEALPAPSAAPARSGRYIVLSTNGANVVTDVENVNANVNANRKMMVDGQLVIIRDGKMFNAQGQEL